MKAEYRNPAYEMAYDFPEYRGEPLRTLWVATTPRSGSSLFAFLCRQAGAYGFPLEYYTAINAAVIKRRVVTVDDSLPAYTAALTKLRTSENGIFGFKLHFDEMPAFMDAGGLDLPMLKNAYVVLLDRRDRLGQAISLIIAAKTNQWIDLPGYRMAAEGEPVYDRQVIVNVMAKLDYQYEQWRASLAQLGYPVLSLAYEDVVADCEGVFRSLADFLGISEVPKPSLDAVEINRQDNPCKQEWKMRFLAGK